MTPIRELMSSRNSSSRQNLFLFCLCFNDLIALSAPAISMFLNNGLDPFQTPIGIKTWWILLQALGHMAPENQRYRCASNCILHIYMVINQSFMAHTTGGSTIKSKLSEQREAQSHTWSDQSRKRVTRVIPLTKHFWRFKNWLIPHDKITGLRNFMT